MRRRQRRLADTLHEAYATHVYGDERSIATAIDLRGNSTPTPGERKLWAVRIANHRLFREYLTEENIASNFEIPSARDSDQITVANPEAVNDALDAFVSDQTFAIDAGSDGSDDTITPQILGDAFERVVNDLSSTDGRANTGAFYTPPTLAETLAERAVRSVVLRRARCEFESKPVVTNTDSLNELIDNADRDLVRAIRDTVLDNLRILDPSCGAGHFLVAVLDELLRVHRRVADALDEPFDSFETRQELIETAIFGADIEEHAVEIAMFRLQLSLVNERPTIESIADVECNLQAGNGLVGVATPDEIPDTEDGRPTEAYLSKLNGLTVDERLPTDSMEERLVEIERLNRIKVRFDASIEGYDEVIETAERRGFTAYSKSAATNIDPDTTRVGDIVAGIDAVIDTLPADIGHLETVVTRGVEGSEVREMNGLHWPIAFPEAFYGDRDGFDLVVGNPPHGADIEGVEKEIVRHLYRLTDDATETTKLFVERAQRLAATDGEIWFVVPKASGYSYSWRDYREFCEPRIFESLDLGQAFHGVAHEQVSVALASSAGESSGLRTGVIADDGPYLHGELPRYSIDELGVIPTNLSQEEYALIESVVNGLPKVGECAEITRGFPKADGVPALAGRDVQRHYFRTATGTVDPDRAGDRRRRIVPTAGKTVVQRIASNRSNPEPHLKVTAHHDPHGLPTVETVTNIVPETFPAKFLSFALNSRFLSWYVRRAVFGNALRDVDVDAYFIERFPIPNLDVAAPEGKDREEVLEAVCVLVDALSTARTLAAHADVQISRGEIDRLYETVNLLAHDLYLAGLPETNPHRTDGVLVEQAIAALAGVTRPDDRFPLPPPSRVTPDDDLESFVREAIDALSGANVEEAAERVAGNDVVTGIERRFPEGVGEEDPGDGSATLEAIKQVSEGIDGDGQRTLDSFKRGQ